MTKPVKGPRFTLAEVEAHVVPDIVAALYPIFYPVDSRSANQERHHAKVTEVATAAWRLFTGRAALQGEG